MSNNPILKNAFEEAAKREIESLDKEAEDLENECESDKSEENKMGDAIAIFPFDL